MHLAPNFSISFSTAFLQSFLISFNCWVVVSILPWVFLMSFSTFPSCSISFWIWSFLVSSSLVTVSGSLFSLIAFSSILFSSALTSVIFCSMALTFSTESLRTFFPLMMIMFFSVSLSMSWNLEASFFISVIWALVASTFFSILAFWASILVILVLRVLQVFLSSSIFPGSVSVMSWLWRSASVFLESSSDFPSLPRFFSSFLACSTSL